MTSEYNLANKLNINNLKLLGAIHKVRTHLDGEGEFDKIVWKCTIIHERKNQKRMYVFSTN